MRVVSLLTHSTTLLVLQQAVIVWFLVDFFLARESATTHKLLNEHVTRSSSAIDTIEQIEAVSKDLKSSLSCDDLLLNPPAFDKLIFVVVDALGSEFIRSIPSTPSNDDHNHGTKSPLKMPFLEQSLASHQAMGFVAKAATPTVTMPRIKALVSGTIPSFMDIVYNLASNTADFNEDNILSAARTRGKTIVFYGDDTWLSLFDKSIFKRSRETLSFYASDHTSVDTNVTEMALPETNRDPIDWDYMILHYLGLDHIGHVYGTNESPLIDKKLLEMDSVIKEMYNNMAAKNHKTLFVICGDHGMSSEGNHGGGTRLESETAMLFLPINQQLTITESHDNKEVRIAQIDLASTLATLTGLPIPTTSRGVIIKPLLKGIWHTDVKRLTCASINNLKQLSLLLDDSEFSSPGGLGIQVLQLLHRMSKNSSIENEQSFAQQCIELARALQANLVRVVATRSNNFLVILVVVFVVLLSIINLRRACNRLLMPLMSHTERLTCLGSVLVPVILLNSTDFIEMEHIFWPLYSITILALFCLVALRSHRLRSIIQDIEHFRVVLFVITFLIAALWNHISLLGHHDWGWSLPVISTMILCNYTRQTSKLSGKQSISPFVFGLLMLTTKFIEETSENHQMVAVLQLITLITLVLAGVAHLYISFRKDYDLQSTSIVLKLATYWMWWIFLLSRSRNYLFLIANVVMEVSLNSIANSFKFNPIARAIVYLQFSNNAFFGQGNSNLFSTLDIKPAFYGQTQYSIILAVPLVACSTFGSLIYWYIKLFQRVQGEKEQERMSIRSELIDETNTSNLIPEGTKDAIKDFVDMRNFLTIAYYLFVCMVLRDHLFIWSVLSPKLVYLFMATLTTRLMTTMISNLPHLIVRALGHRDKFGGVKYKLISD